MKEMIHCVVSIMNGQDTLQRFKIKPESMEEVETFANFAKVLFDAEVERTELPLTLKIEILLQYK